MHIYGLCGHGITRYIVFIRTMGCSRFGFELLRDFHQLRTSHTYYNIHTHYTQSILYYVYRTTPAQTRIWAFTVRVKI